MRLCNINKWFLHLYYLENLFIDQEKSGSTTSGTHVSQNIFQLRNSEQIFPLYYGNETSQTGRIQLLSLLNCLIVLLTRNNVQIVISYENRPIFQADRNSKPNHLISKINLQLVIPY